MHPEDEPCSRCGQRLSEHVTVRVLTGIPLPICPTAFFVSQTAQDEALQALANDEPIAPTLKDA